MKETKKEIRALEEFFDDDPTDELPVLTGLYPDDIAAPADDDQSPEDTGLTPVLRLPAEQADVFSRIPTLRPEPVAAGELSLRRLEDEFQTLQTRFLDLETELRSRDEQIERLSAELQEGNEAIMALEAELGEAADRELDLESSRGELQANLQYLRAENANQAEIIEAANAESANLRAELESAQARVVTTEAMAAQRDAAAATAAAESAQQIKQLAGRHIETNALRRRIADLEQYIDGRRQHWLALQAKVTQQSRNIAALERAAVALAKRSNLKDKALERQRQESEEHKEISLQRGQALGAAEQQIGKLGAELAALHQAHVSLQHDMQLSTHGGQDLQARISEQSAVISELEERLALADGQRVELENRLTTAEETGNTLAAEIQSMATESAVQIGRIEDLQLQLKIARASEAETEAAAARASELGVTQAIALDAAERELAATARQRAALAEKLAASEREVSRLQARLSELEANADQRQALVENLETELREKLATIDVITRSAERLGELENRMQNLDARMSETYQRGSQPSATHQVTQVIVATSGDRAVKYPLYKTSMTIGRAPDSDIQIRRQYISRYHARLLTGADGTFIEDLGSKNGVLVNAHRVERHRLRNGDLFDIGKMQFQFIDLLEPHAGQGNA